MASDTPAFSMVDTAVTLVALTGDADLAGRIKQYAQDAAQEPLTLSVVGDPEKASRALAEAGILGVALYDLRGGGTNHHNLLAAIPIISRSGPVIGLVDSEASQVAQGALAAGATDVLAIADLSGPLLRRAVRYALARRESERKLTRLRLFDPITSLPSQILFWEILSLAVRRAKRNRDFFAVLLVDIENLPDGHGEDGPYRDLAMRELAERITPILRSSDTIARFEQQQLAILAESMPRVEDIQIVAEKIIEEFVKPLDAGGGPLSVNVAIGISLYPTSATGAEGLLSRATDAMLQARDHGSNLFVFA
ncbi:GGDEF domain-containing protein [Dongia rigui]|uniref:GGDEF domain-containing protein n=1 Tax=Dongia rigui TaxID=940149 RepID=A0ABU5DVI4_9PROT|nr:GGDEF domain-containing protein [Dongia rigui]MDY0871228.1 GGDEF domain-containing protein [Dongia rigui]